MRPRTTNRAHKNAVTPAARTKAKPATPAKAVTPVARTKAKPATPAKAGTPAARTKAKPATRTAPGRSTKKRRERLELDARRDAFLATGLAVFSARSYDEVSIDDLAAAAGVSKGLLYHYFPTKRDFYVAALATAAAQLIEETRNDDLQDPAADLARGLVTYLDFARRHGPAYLALMRGGIGSDPEVHAVLEETRNTLGARALERMPPGAVTPLVKVAVRGWIGFVETTAIDWLTDDSIAKKEIVRLACAVFFDAVARAGDPAFDQAP